MDCNSSGQSPTRLRPGAWNPGKVAMIKRLLPHIRQFVRIRQALTGAEALAASLADSLDDMRIGMICLDWRGMIVEANSRACAILRHRDGLVDRGGFLHARVPADDRRLGELFVDALPRPRARGDQRFDVAHPFVRSIGVRTTREAGGP